VRGYVDGDGATGIIADPASASPLRTAREFAPDAIGASIAASVAGDLGVAVSSSVRRVSLAKNQISNEVMAYLKNAHKRDPHATGDIALKRLPHLGKFHPACSRPLPAPTNTNAALVLGRHRPIGPRATPAAAPPAASYRYIGQDYNYNEPIQATTANAGKTALTTGDTVRPHGGYTRRRCGWAAL